MDYKKIDELIKKYGVVLVDSREQENGHIINFLKKHGIKYRIEKLDYGDYSMVIEIPEREIITLVGIITIERKDNLSELATNLGKKRKQFLDEIQRSKGKFILMIERITLQDFLKFKNYRHKMFTDSSWKDIIDFMYRGDLKPNSYYGTLQALQARYGIYIEFIDKRLSGKHIYSKLTYHAREILKGEKL